MFERPETLPATAAELNELLAAARADIHLISARRAAGEKLTADDLARLRSLVADAKDIDAAHEAAVVAETPLDEAELDALLSEAAAGGTPAETPVEDAPEAPAAEDVPADEVEAPAEPELVTAGAPARVNFGGAGADQAPADVPANAPGWNLHPSTPGYKSGQGKVGFRDIALSLDKIRPGSRASIRPNRPNRVLGGEEFARQVVSTLDREVGLVSDPHSLYTTIMEKTKSSNLVEATFNQRGSLVAAGGWCAPSEQLYDFCDVPDATDLISLPEITIERGGVRWPREPDLSGIFADFEWFFTEPELEAVDVNGNPTAIKTCVEVPCADEFDEIRLNAVGWCVESGILQEQGWPELVEWFMRWLTQEHLRALSRRTILDMVAGSGAEKVIPATSTLGSAPSALNSIALMAMNLRINRGLARTATIEGVAPSWFHEVLRADLAMRQGTDVFAVTDQQINGWLSARNVALQFVGDWQTRGAGQPGNLATLKWPTAVNVLLYPAGTWFRSMSNVIELGVMYPKEQLQVNRFTRMFTEDAIAVGKRCGNSINVKIALDVNGAVGAREAVTNA